MGLAVHQWHRCPPSRLFEDGGGLGEAKRCHQGRKAFVRIEGPGNSDLLIGRMREA